MTTGHFYLRIHVLVSHKAKKITSHIMFWCCGGMHICKYVASRNCYIIMMNYS